MKANQTSFQSVEHSPKVHSQERMQGEAAESVSGGNPQRGCLSISESIPGEYQKLLTDANS